MTRSYAEDQEHLRAAYLEDHPMTIPDDRGKEALSRALHGNLPNCIALSDPYCHACSQVAYTVMRSGERAVFLPDGLDALVARERRNALNDARTAIRRLNGDGFREPSDPALEAAEAAVLALLRSTSPAWGDMTQEQRYRKWHAEVCARDAAGCMCSCHEGYGPEPR